MTTDTEAEVKSKHVQLRPSTHIRLMTSRILDGETLDSVINRALDALKRESQK